MDSLANMVTWVGININIFCIVSVALGTLPSVRVSILHPPDALLIIINAV